MPSHLTEDSRRWHCDLRQYHGQYTFIRSQSDVIKSTTFFREKGSNHHPFNIAFAGLY